MRLDLFFKVSNVILDDDDEDDGEEFLIEEAPKDPLVSLEAGDEAAVEAGGQEHGVLVQQVETKLVKSVKTYKKSNYRSSRPKRSCRMVTRGTRRE